MVRRCKTCKALTDKGLPFSRSGMPSARDLDYRAHHDIHPRGSWPLHRSQHHNLLPLLVGQAGRKARRQAHSRKDIAPLRAHGRKSRRGDSTTYVAPQDTQAAVSRTASGYHFSSARSGGRVGVICRNSVTISISETPSRKLVASLQPLLLAICWVDDNHTVPHICF